LLILGDINIHLDIADDDNTVAFMSLLDQHSLTQHIAAATHRGGHTLDIVVTRSDRPITTLDIGRPRIFSDHSFITAEIDLQFQHGQAVQEIRRRHWRRMNFDQLCDDIACSDLLVDPPSDAVGLFTCYNETLQALIDKHAPYGAVKVPANSNAPWFDYSCRVQKTETRRLERAYQRDQTADAFDVWRRQSRFLRFFLRERHAEYWSATLSACARDPKALWSKIDAILRPPSSSISAEHTATEFALYFQSKVDAIRLATDTPASSIII